MKKPDYATRVQITAILLSFIFFVSFMKILPDTFSGAVASFVIAALVYGGYVYNSFTTKAGKEKLASDASGK